MIKLKKWMMNPCEECTHILSDETGEAVIVDCGAYCPNERRHLLEYIEKEQLHPVRLLLTHAHHDHVYGNDLIHVHYGLLPEVHEGDKEQMTVQLRMRIDEIYKEYPYSLPMPEHYLTDNEVIRFGNHELRVIHTPGHTPGSVFFYCEAEGIAFSGDTLFCKGIGRSDFPGGSRDELMTSLKYVTELLPNETTIYPGHGNNQQLVMKRKTIRF